MKNKIRKITITAILSALCVILYFYVKFPLPFFPAFLEINFSMLPAIIGGYIIGPMYASIIVVFRFLVKIGASHTATVGEIADLLIGLSVVFTTSIIYKNNKTKNGAIFSLICGSFVWIVTATLFNYLLLVPTYIKIYFNGNLEAFIAVLKIIPGINETNYMQKYLLFAVVPFNALLSIIVSIITFYTYKPLKRLFINEKNHDETKVHKNDCEKIMCVISRKNDKEIEIVLKIKK